MNYLLPVHTIGVRHTPPAMRLNRVFPDFPVVPDCRKREKRDIIAFKRGRGHPVSLLRQKTTGYANTAIGYGLNYTRWQQLFCICLLLLTPLLAGFFFLCW